MGLTEDKRTGPPQCVYLFSLHILHIDIFINKIYLFVMISHTSSVCIPRVLILFRGVPTLKHTSGAKAEVFFHLVGMVMRNDRFYLFLS